MKKLPGVTRIILAFSVAYLIGIPDVSAAAPSRAFNDPKTGTDCLDIVERRFTPDRKRILVRFHNNCGKILTINYAFRSGHVGSVLIFPQNQRTIRIAADDLNDLTTNWMFTSNNGVKNLAAPPN